MAEPNNGVGCVTAMLLSKWHSPSQAPSTHQGADQCIEGAILLGFNKVRY